MLNNTQSHVECLSLQHVAQEFSINLLSVHIYSMGWSLTYSAGNLREAAPVRAWDAVAGNPPMPGPHNLQAMTSLPRLLWCPVPRR